MKKIKLLTLLLAISTLAFAQTPFSLTGSTASQNFDAGALDNGTGSTLNTFPTGWGLHETGSGTSANGFYRAGTGSSGAGDARSFGATSSQERSFGSLGSGSVRPTLGFGFTNNTGNTITQMNVSYVGEQWRTGDSLPLVDTLVFEYSLNASSISDTSASWVSVNSLNFLSPVPIYQGALVGNLAANQTNLSGVISASVPNTNTVYFRWRDGDISGTEDGLSVDDFSMTVTTSGGPLPPALLSTIPADNATNVPLSTASLSFTLDQAITSVAATGNVQLTDITNTSTVNITAANITFSGATVTLGGVSLNSNTDYAVQIDSNLFMTATGGYAGIYDNTTWNFKTENTTPPAAVTSLNETFTGCLDPIFGVFTAHSEVGAQNWRCTTFGHNDSNAVRMNGYSGAPLANVDWLVSPPLDFSGMAMPHLHLWGKLRFPANTTKEILVSTNYSGVGSPASATWTAVQGPNWPMLDTTWQYFSNTDLTTYKSAVFYIAFKYTSTTTDADEWSIDDILVTDGPLSTSTFTSTDLKVRVLGDVTSQLNLQTVSSKSRNLNYSLLDMAGRTIEKGNLNIFKGKEQHSLDVSSMNSGLYFLQLNNEQAKTIVKFIIK